MVYFLRGVGYIHSLPGQKTAGLWLTQGGGNYDFTTGQYFPRRLYIYIFDLKDRMNDKNPLPLTESKKKDLICEEGLRVSRTVGQDLHVNMGDDTLLYEIRTNLDVFDRARVYVWRKCTSLFVGLAV